MCKVAAAAACAALLVAGAGCGGGGGVAAGATVTAYVDASLCAEARRELEDANGRAGEVRVRVVCVARTGDGGRLNLATVGANARRASEDSTAVAYLEPPGPATRFTTPILESAGIAEIEARSGKTGMAKLLTATQGADAGSFRESVRSSLEGS
jgi:hypothetical protein